MKIFEIMATGSKSSRAVALENLNKKKDLYPLTRELDNVQFDLLLPEEKTLLMVNWSFPR